MWEVYFAPPEGLMPQTAVYFPLRGHSNPRIVSLSLQEAYYGFGVCVVVTTKGMREFMTVRCGHTKGMREFTPMRCGHTKGMREFTPMRCGHNKGMREFTPVRCGHNKRHA